MSIYPMRGKYITYLVHSRKRKILCHHLKCGGDQQFGIWEVNRLPEWALYTERTTRVRAKDGNAYRNQSVLFHKSQDHINHINGRILENRLVSHTVIKTHGYERYNN